MDTVHLHNIHCTPLLLRCQGLTMTESGLERLVLRRSARNQLGFQYGPPNEWLPDWICGDGYERPLTYGILDVGRRLTPMLNSIRLCAAKMPDNDQYFLGHSLVEQRRLQQQAEELAEESGRLFDQS